MAWVVDSLLSGWPVVEATGTAKSLFAVINDTAPSEQWASNTSLTYTLYDGETAVLSGTATSAGFPYLQTSIAITTALNPSKVYRAVVTGTVVGGGADPTTGVVSYARREYAQTVPMRRPPVTSMSLTMLAPIGTAPSTYFDGTWQPAILLAWNTIGQRVLTMGRGDLVTPGSLDNACAWLALSNVFGYRAGYGSAAMRTLRDDYLTRYAVEMDRLGLGWDTTGDNVADTTVGADGTGAGAL